MTMSNILVTPTATTNDLVASAFDRARQAHRRVLIAALKPARLHRAPAMLAAGADLVEVTGDPVPVTHALRQMPDLALLPLVLRVERHGQPAHVPVHLAALDVAHLLRGVRHYVAVETPIDDGAAMLAALRSRLRLVRALTRLPLAVRDTGTDAVRAVALAGLADALVVDGDGADIAAVAASLARRGAGHLRAV
jgi:hypothetical protein